MPSVAQNLTDCKMSIKKTMIVGRPKMAFKKKKVTWSFSIDKELLALMRRKAAHGKIAAWARARLWEAVNDRSAR